MSFKTGDRVRAKIDGGIGSNVVKTGDFGTISGRWGSYYKVTFDTCPYSIFCHESEIEGLPQDEQAQYMAQCSSPPNSKTHSHPSICLHTFQTYVGFREAYDYCVHCDSKRAIPK